MSKQSDNYVDETLEDILFEYENGQNPHQDEDYRFERTKTKLDQYYADFYRNKILEARAEGHHSGRYELARELIPELEKNLTSFTAQLNKGDK